MMSRLLVDVTPLRASRDFRLIFFGQSFSLLGSNVTMVAIPYQVYRDTHSSLLVGMASLVQLPTLIIGSLGGGGLGDLFDKRRLLVASSLALAATSAGLALNATGHTTGLALLFVLAALSAGLGGLAGPLRTAAIPQLVGDELLVPAYSLNQVVVNLATVVGPALAGVLIASIGLAACYGVDAVTFVVLAIASFAMSPLAPPGRGDERRLLSAIAEGFGYVRRHRIAQAVYLVDLNAMVFGLPRALFPAVALSVYHGGPRVLGLLYAAPGAGALVMAVLTGWVARVQRRGRLVSLVVIVWGLAMATFGLAHSIWLGLACLAVAGAMDVISTILRNTILQRAITDEFRSRVSSIQLAVVTGGPRLGDVESGTVASITSTQFSIVSGGIACVIGVLAVLAAVPAFWRARDL